MSIWALVPLLLLASALACPIMMWVMGKVTKGRLDCMACFPGMGNKQQRDAKMAEERVVVLERDIALLRSEIGPRSVEYPPERAPVADARSGR